MSSLVIPGHCTSSWSRFEPSNCGRKTSRSRYFPSGHETHFTEESTGHVTKDTVLYIVIYHVAMSQDRPRSRKLDLACFSGPRSSGPLPEVIFCTYVSIQEKPSPTSVQWEGCHGAVTSAVWTMLRSPTKKEVQLNFYCTLATIWWISLGEIVEDNDLDMFSGENCQ